MVGTATISIELELGWGVVRFGKLDKISPGRERETRYLSRLLDRCDEYDVPITFDVVGHLFFEECDGDHGGPHPDGWWDVDPGSFVDEHPKFYAPDLLEDIRSRETDHEICTHTFSHVECDEVDADVVRWELERAQRVHENHGVPRSDSIVPPRHSAPPADALLESGIRVKRTPSHRSAAATEASTRREKLYEILFGAHSTAPPAEVDGVLETYSPEYITFAAPYLQTGTYQPHPVYRPLPVALRRRLHAWNLRRGLDRAVEDDSFVHYWSHLYDFANDQQWPQVESFVADLGRRRAVGEMEVRTMRELPDAASRRDCDDAATVDAPTR